MYLLNYAEIQFTILHGIIKLTLNFVFVLLYPDKTCVMCRTSTSNIYIYLHNAAYYTLNSIIWKWKFIINTYYIL